MSTLPVVATSGLGPVVTTRVATAISLFWIVMAASVDRLYRHLPDALVLLALLPTALGAAVLTLQGSTTAAAGVGLGAATWGLPVLLAHLIAPTGLGFGDVKAAGVVGATVGLTQSAPVATSALVLAVAAAVTTGRSGRGELALGPWLAFGAVASLAVGGFAGSVS